MQWVSREPTPSCYATPQLLCLRGVPVLGRGRPGCQLELGVALVCVLCLKAKWKQVQGGRHWLGSCKHPSLLRSHRLRLGRPGNVAGAQSRYMPVGAGAFLALPLRPNLSFHPSGSGWELLCWHKAFKGRRSRKKAKGTLPVWRYQLLPGLPGFQGLGIGRELSQSPSSPGNHSRQLCPHVSAVARWGRAEAGS